MQADEIKIIQFDTDAQFSIWKTSNSAVDILNIDFIPSVQGGGQFKSAPKVASFIATDGQTDFNLGTEFEYTMGLNQLMVFWNGTYLLVENDYVEVDTRTIKIKEALEEGDVIAVIIDNSYFEQVDNSQVLGAYKILVAYRELANRSVAQVKNISVIPDSAGVYISWEDIFGTNIEQALGTDWKDKEGFKDNLEYMTFMDWRGVRVVRKEGSQPYGINDGSIILESTKLNGYSTMPFLDKADNLTLGKTYYYAIFPYDGWGNYNTDSVNIVSVEFTRQDWSQLTKKVSLTIVKPASDTLEVKWSDPDIGDWRGTKIVINDTEPADVNDGTVAIDNIERNKYANNGFRITGLQNNKRYYIKAFAYDKNGIVRMASTAVSDFPIVVLENITIDFSDDTWKDYFADMGIAQVVGAADSSDNKVLSIKPTYINVDRFGNVLETVFACKLKPVEYTRNGSIVIWYKTRSSIYGTFEISLEDQNKTEYRSSGYQLEFNFKRFNVDTGYPELILKLLSRDLNAEVMIDKIVFER